MRETFLFFWGRPSFFSAVNGPASAAGVQRLNWGPLSPARWISQRSGFTGLPGQKCIGQFGDLEKFWSSVTARARPAQELSPKEPTHATPSPTDRPRPSTRTCPPPPAMSLSCRYAARSCARQLLSTSCLRPTGAVAHQRLTTTRRCESTAAAAPANPKIATIVDQISQLTLLETADLVASLKVGTRHGATTLRAERS